MSIRTSLDASLSIARKLAAWAEENGLSPAVPAGGTDRIVLFDNIVEHQAVRDASRQLYRDAHYSLAVQQACIALDCAVRAKSGCQKDGADLMFAVFADSNPILRFNRCRTPSEKNEQAGYMFILAGVMRGVRNPRAHEVPYVDDPDTALRLLGLVDHLFRKLDPATKVRKKKP